MKSDGRTNLEKIWHLADLPHDQLRALLSMAEADSVRCDGFCIVCAVALALVNLLYFVRLAPLFGLSIDLLLFPILWWVFRRARSVLGTVMDACIATGDGQFLGAALTRLQMLKSRAYVPDLDERRAAEIRGTQSLFGSREDEYETQGTIVADARGSSWDKIRSGIKRMLAVVSAADYGALTTEQRGALLAFIEQPYDEELATLILGMLARLKEPGALQSVAHLAGNAAASAQLRARAQECLQQLKAHIAEQQQKDLLLRAASGSAVVQPDILLRPAQQNADVAVDQLLRADERADEEGRPA